MSVSNINLLVRHTHGVSSKEPVLLVIIAYPEGQVTDGAHRLWDRKRRRLPCVLLIPYGASSTDMGLRVITCISQSK